MIKNYLKVAWRNLFRNKVQSFINIAGLSVGLACSLLILLWLQNEESIDGFHSDRLYSIIGLLHANHKVSGMYDTLRRWRNEDVPAVSAEIALRSARHHRRSWHQRNVRR